MIKPLKGLTDNVILYLMGEIESDNKVRAAMLYKEHMHMHGIFYNNVRAFTIVNCYYNKYFR